MSTEKKLLNFAEIEDQVAMELPSREVMNVMTGPSILPGYLTRYLTGYQHVYRPEYQPEYQPEYRPYFPPQQTISTVKFDVETTFNFRVHFCATKAKLAYDSLYINGAACASASR